MSVHSSLLSGCCHRPSVLSEGSARAKTQIAALSDRSDVSLHKRLPQARTQSPKTHTHAQTLSQHFRRPILVRRASSTESETTSKAGGTRPALTEEPGTADAGEEIELDPESDEAKKKAEAERLRKAEKFMTITTGRALCVSCGYEYEQKRGDPEYPITPGTQFGELPKDWQCPVCGAPKVSFQSQNIKVAGFAENQQYGLGGNSLTAGQKSLLIYGSLIFFFGLFIAGYLLQ